MITLSEINAAYRNGTPKEKRALEKILLEDDKFINALTDKPRTQLLLLRHFGEHLPGAQLEYFKRLLYSGVRV